MKKTDPRNLPEKALDNLNEPRKEDLEALPPTSVPGNPSAHGTAEGPEDEENMYGNDVTGPNLGADLSEEQPPLDPADDLSTRKDDWRLGQASPDGHDEPPETGRG